MRNKQRELEGIKTFFCRHRPALRFRNVTANYELFLQAFNAADNDVTPEGLFERIKDQLVVSTA